ncbi:MAG: DUF87 domain-containing protein [Clostridiales bacterium]|nr:DUF87 domain-containing protein [Clostridiales bacterium]
MNGKITLSRYCDQATADRGAQLLEGVTCPKTERTAEGGLRMWARVIDPFHFVSHVSVTMTGDALTDFHCDCPFGGRDHRVCRHVAALLICAGQGIPAENGEDAGPAAEETAAEPEPTATEELPIEAEPPAAEEPPTDEGFVTAEPVVPEEEPELPEEEPTLDEVAPAPEEEPPVDEEPPELSEEGPRSMEILFGNRLEDGEPVYWRPNDTEQVFHTNLGIIGTMGTGKTQFTKSIVSQMYRSQRDNFDGSRMGFLIFDYKGDYNETKADFGEAAHTRVLKPYRLPYNPLALNRTRAFKPLLPMHTANVFKDTVSKIYGLGPKQQQTMLDCIVRAYERQGIDPEDDGTWGKKAPTFEQVYQIFVRETDGRTPDSLTAAMNKLHQFRIFEPDPAKARSLASVLGGGGVVVVDLSGYDEDIQSLVVAITLDQFYAQMQTYGSSRTDGRYRQLRNLILVDEADNFMSQGFPSLRKIMKEGREFGVGVILSTQSLSHFVGGSDDYSRYVLTWVVHNVSDLKQRDVEYVFKLQPKSPEIAATYGAIKGLAKHESVVKFSEGTPFALRDRAFWQLCQEWGIS